MKYINADELAGIMKDAGKAPGRDYLVVDVRDDDFVGGNIVGCLNKPASEFLAHVDSVVKDTKDVPLIVFHCALSQVRGPKAARIYEQTRKHMYGDDDVPHEVAVLREGFTLFQQKFKDDPALVENYKEEYWRTW